MDVVEISHNKCLLKFDFWEAIGYNISGLPVRSGSGVLPRHMVRQHRRGFNYLSCFSPILISLLISVCLGLSSIACKISLSVLLFSFNPMNVVFFFVHSLWAFDSGIATTSGT
nr:MAG TPA: hypothetical protein [Caudoviricetes sp.]